MTGNGATPAPIRIVPAWPIRAAERTRSHWRVRVAAGAFSAAASGWTVRR